MYVLKIVIVSFLSFLLFCSCAKAKKKESVKKTNTRFVIKGSFDRYFTSKVYLHQIKKQKLYLLDSSEVSNNTFTFTGIVKTPEKRVLTYKNSAIKTIFIAENKELSIHINTINNAQTTIKNSPLNDALKAYKNHSKQIFNQLDFLYASFQKARLENDYKKIKEISKKIKAIEREFHHYTFSYIANHSNSYLAAILLKEQLNVRPIDSIALLKAYKKLSSKVKKSTDAKAVAKYLGFF